MPTQKDLHAIAGESPRRQGKRPQRAERHQVRFGRRQIASSHKDRRRDDIRRCDRGVGRLAWGDVVLSIEARAAAAEFHQQRIGGAMLCPACRGGADVAAQKQAIFPNHRRRRKMSGPSGGGRDGHVRLALTQQRSLWNARGREFKRQPDAALAARGQLSGECQVALHVIRGKRDPRGFVSRIDDAQLGRRFLVVERLLTWRVLRSGLLGRHKTLA